MEAQNVQIETDDIMKRIIALVNCVNGSYILYNCMNNKQEKKCVSL